MAVIVDGEKQDTMPTSPQGKDNKYYQVDVSCTSSKTTGLWDYNAWRLNLDYIESNSKCNLTFTSSMSKDQYDEYIKSGVALRRNTYRGKDITDYQKLPEDNPMNLYKQIESGNFNDIYVGDYIVSDQKIEINGVEQPIIWLIADLDNYLGTSYDIELGHHATIIPAYKLMNAQMNSIDSTDNGYVGSEMVTKVLGSELVSGQDTILSKYIYPVFGNHILKYKNLLVNKTDSNKISIENAIIQDDGKVSANGSAIPNGWDFYERYLDLMSEVNVFGTAISSGYFNIGIDSQQYAIFRLKPELIYQDLNGNRYTYFLKGIVNSSNYAGVGDLGHPVILHSVNKNVGVRPRFLID